MVRDIIYSNPETQMGLWLRDYGGRKKPVLPRCFSRSKALGGPEEAQKAVIYRKNDNRLSGEKR